MTTISGEPSRVASERRRWSQVLIGDMWTALAIAIIWLAVLLDALFGPDIVTTSAGGDSVVVPSAVVVTFFAFLATWVVAKYGFHRDRTD
jgi:hypothetical protein